MEPLPARLLRHLYAVLFYALGFWQARQHGGSLLGSVVTMLGLVLLADLSYAGWRSLWKRGALVTSVVRALCAETSRGPFWTGSPARLWISLFLIGTCVDASGRRVDLSVGVP